MERLGHFLLARGRIVGFLDIDLEVHARYLTPAVTVGDRVNLEADILGKVVAKLLGRGDAAGGLTMDRLREAGW